MRRLQLKVISITYLVSNLLILGEVMYLILFVADAYESCAQLCSQPYDSKGAAIVLLLGICHLLPAQFNLVSFWFIPKRFNVEIYGGRGDDIYLDNIDTPLLHLRSDLDKIDDDRDWQVRQEQYRRSFESESEGSMLSKRSKRKGS